MSAPTTHQPILQPPDPSKARLFEDKVEEFKYYYEIWRRTGGYKSAISNIRGLTASVKELNTLVGIKTDDSVQEQIDAKASTASLGTMAFQNKGNVDITGGSASDVVITGGSTSGSIISGSLISVQAGTSVSSVYLGGALVSNMAAVGNTGTGEDNLIIYAMPADVLSVNGQILEISAWGTVAANANNKRIKLKIGAATILDTTAVAANSGSWWINATIVRIGAASEQVISKIISDNALISNDATYTAIAEDTTTALNIFCTGEATNNNDIVQNGLIVKWFKV